MKYHHKNDKGYIIEWSGDHKEKGVCLQKGKWQILIGTEFNVAPDYWVRIYEFKHYLSLLTK